MLRDLSETLQAILRQPGLPTELAAAQVVFERPVESFAPTQTTIDLFLYDIRENIELRSNEPLIERANNQAVIRRPPLRIACTYLVTAWPVGGTESALQEHRLLSQVLQVLSRYALIPAAFLKGSLIGQQPALPMMTARIDGPKDPVEFWAAIGNKLRTSIAVTVTVAFETSPPVTAPLVMTGDVRIGERTSVHEQKLVPLTQMEFFQIQGAITGADHKPVSNATVILVDTGHSAQTDSDGRYRLEAVGSGTYTLRVQVGAMVKNVPVTIPATTGKNYDVQM